MNFKWGVLGIFILLIACVSAAVPDDCDLLMKHYWQFDGNGNDGIGTLDATLTGDSASAEGISENALDLISSSYATISSADLRIATGTYEFWFKFDPGYLPYDVGMDFNIFTKKNDFSLYVDTENKTVLNFEGAEILSTSVIAELQWYHIAIAWDTSTVTLYLNGNLIGSKSTALSWDETTDVYAGRGQDDQYSFFGAFDELAFYSTALNTTTVKQHYNDMLQGKDYCYAAGDVDSETEVVTYTKGCAVLDAVENTVVEHVGFGKCSADRDYYCDQDAGILSTLSEYRACSKGDYKLGNVITCCPTGYSCMIDPDNKDLGPICMPQLVVCEGLAQGDCNEEELCYWLSRSAICVDRSSLSCGVYKDESNCTADIEGLGYRGIGTEICGTFTTRNNLVIPDDSCRCEWDYDEKKCAQAYDIKLEFDETDNDYATCYRFFDDPGACVTGSQTLSWTVSYDPSDADSDYMDSAGCVAGSKMIDCGSNIVKLPFFGWVNFAVTGLAIGGIYIFMRKKKKCLTDREL